MEIDAIDVHRAVTVVGGRRDRRRHDYRGGAGLSSAAPRGEMGRSPPVSCFLMIELPIWNADIDSTPPGCEYRFAWMVSTRGLPRSNLNGARKFTPSTASLYHPGSSPRAAWARP